MRPCPTTRELDLVLFGATGFTGGLTAEYLPRTAPTGCAGRWPAAASTSSPGRETRRAGQTLADVALIVADSADPVALADLAARTKVVASTVGPYVGRGEALVGACAEAGTDYCDITGEGEFVDTMYVAHHATAVASGARLVHGCGFDSIPHDLGAMFTVEQLPADVPIDLRGVVRAGGLPSGGTFETALTGMSRVRQIRDAARRAGASSRGPRTVRRARWPASRTATGCSAYGCCRCPPWTPRSWRGYQPNGLCTDVKFIFITFTNGSRCIRWPRSTLHSCSAIR